MARPLRIEFPGAVYHVTARGDRREAIFEEDEDREVFLEITGLALRRFDACALAYCLLGNHYHLVLHTRQGGLSALMRQINGVYTQAYNRRHGKVGHLFQGRFKAILVDRDAYLLEVCRYVDLNPVRAMMVADPADWPWSSYRALAGLAAPPAWLDTAAVQGYLLGRDPKDSRDRKRAARRYATLVAQGKDVKLWNEALRRQIFLGDEQFVERMQALLTPEQCRAGEVPQVQRSPQPKPIEHYLAGGERDEAIARAYLEGRHSMSAIAAVAGLSVSRISRLIRAWEEAKADGWSRTRKRLTKARHG